MPTPPKTAPYGAWKSPITSDLIVAQTIALADVRLDGGDIYWMEGRPAGAGPQRGRTARRRRRATCRHQPAAVQCAHARARIRRRRVRRSPAAPSIFSQLRRPAALPPAARRQRATRPSTAPPRRPAWRFADGVIDQRATRGSAVREDHTARDEPENTLVAVDLAAAGAAAGRVLVARPRLLRLAAALSPDGSRLAWLTWDHPDMPWDGTELWLAELDARRHCSASRARSPAARTESIFQPEWSPDGGRCISSPTAAGWWNLYRSSRERRDRARWRRCAAEFGQAAMGVRHVDLRLRLPTAHRLQLHREAGLGSSRGSTSRPDASTARPAVHRVLGARAAPTATAPCSWPPRRPSRPRRRARPRRPARIACCEARPTCSSDADADAAVYSVDARAGRVPDQRTARRAYGFYYPPRNPDFAAPAGEQPPLLVMMPRRARPRRASSALDLRTQYWTSRGFAVLDVNYGGSTGYGRAYRERLQRQLGHRRRRRLRQRRALPRRARPTRPSALASRGGSAGGYTTLACARPSATSSRRAPATTASATSRRWRATRTSSSRATSTG